MTREMLAPSSRPELQRYIYILFLYQNIKGTQSKAVLLQRTCYEDWYSHSLSWAPTFTFLQFHTVWSFKDCTNTPITESPWPATSQPSLRFTRPRLHSSCQKSPLTWKIEFWPLRYKQKIPISEAGKSFSPQGESQSKCWWKSWLNMEQKPKTINTANQVTSDSHRNTFILHDTINPRVLFLYSKSTFQTIWTFPPPN